MSARRKQETKDGLHTIKVKTDTFNNLSIDKSVFETWDEYFNRLIKR